MEIIFGIFALLVVISILANMFGGDPSPEELEKAKAELERQRLLLEGGQEKTVEQAKEELKDIATAHLEGEHLEAGTRTLSLFSLVSLSALNFGDMLESTKKADPLIPLTIVYCWLEQLSENYINPGADRFDENHKEQYPEETSSLTKFIWDFTKSELTDEEWESSFLLVEENDDVNSKAFFDELAGFRFVRDRIVGALEDTSMEEKSNLCAVFSSELIEYIDDDDLKERFINLATSSLNDAGLMSDSAKSTLASLEL